MGVIERGAKWLGTHLYFKGKVKYFIVTSYEADSSGKVWFGLKIGFLAFINSGHYFKLTMICVLIMDPCGRNFVKMYCAPFGNYRKFTFSISGTVELSFKLIQDCICMRHRILTFGPYKEKVKSNILQSS